MPTHWNCRTNVILKNIPYHYYPDDDPTKEPVVTWRSAGQLLFSNWLNYYVYQTTPYDIGNK